MKPIVFLFVLFAGMVRADEPLDAILGELRDLKQRVAALEEANRALRTQIETDRLVIRRELIVSDTGEVWEEGFAAQQIPRGIYARALHDGPGGLWVRSRLIKGEVDDPFDDRFHAVETDGSLRRAPGHISWNVWLDGAWRQMAIVQGEGLEFSELPADEWSGGSHPGRIRFQTFRPGHDEPLTDALIGQGKMAVGGGGYGGGGLPPAREILELRGGEIRMYPIDSPQQPEAIADDGSGPHMYAVVAVDPAGRRSPPSPPVHTAGVARLRWDSVPGADAYVVLRDDREVTPPLRIEGSRKEWDDRPGSRQ